MFACKTNIGASAPILTTTIAMPKASTLTPTSIAVVDTTSSVRSRTLLKVLFDPGSTSTVISCKCLPRHCKPCAITNKHKIHTRVGLVGNSDFWFQFLGAPSEAKFRFRFWFQRIRWDFFLNSTEEKLSNWNSDSKIWNSDNNLRTNSVHLILYQKTIAISFPAKITSCRHLNIYSKQVATISKSPHNGCHHLYIYSKGLLPSLHLLKTVAAIPTSTQNSCRHTYIYSKRLPPYLHLLKTVAAIPTSTQNE